MGSGSRGLQTTSSRFVTLPLVTMRMPGYKVEFIVNLNCTPSKADTLAQDYKTFACTTRIKILRHIGSVQFKTRFQSQSGSKNLYAGNTTLRFLCLKVNLYLPDDRGLLEKHLNIDRKIVIAGELRHRNYLELYNLGLYAGCEIYS